MIHCPECGSRAEEYQESCVICGSLLGDAGRKVIGGRYILKKKIGGGNMGTVYLCEDNRLNGKCVLKELTPKFLDSEMQRKSGEWFKREAAILCKLRHSNIPVVIDYFREKERYYLAMDYVPGKNLEEQRLPMDPEKVMEFARTALKILGYLHENGIIHRDIKTDHFIREKDTGKIYLVDFGTARIFEPREKGTAIGTTGFASPEHYEGKADSRSDIYSLGATLHHLLTGEDPRMKPPFNFEKVEKLNPDVPKKLANAVNRALAYRAEERFPTAAAMLDFLDGKDVFAEYEALDNLLPPDEITAEPVESLAGIEEKFEQKDEKSVGRIEERIEEKTGGTLGMKVESLLGDLLDEPDYGGYQSIRRKPRQDDALDGLTESSGKFARMVRKIAPGGGEWFVDMTFLNPGNSIAAAKVQGEIVVWDLKRGEINCELKRHVVSMSLCTCLASSKNGELLAQGFDDRQIQVWDVVTGRRLFALQGHYRGISSLAFIGNDFLASGDEDGTMILWDLQKGDELKRFEKDASALTAMAVTFDGKILVTGDKKGKIEFYNLNRIAARNLIIPSENAHRNAVTDLSLTLSGEYMVSTGADSMVRVWRLERGREVTPITLSTVSKAHHGSVTCAACSPTSGEFITGGVDGELKLWNLEKGQSFHVFQDVYEPVKKAAWSGNGRYFAAFCEKGRIFVWENRV